MLAPTLERRHEPEDLLVQVRQRQDRQEPVRGPNARTRIIVVALAMRLPWLSIAPLGSPVVPLVNTISARVAPVTGRRRRSVRPAGEVGQGLDEQDREAELARRGLRLTARDDQLRLRLADDLPAEVDRVPDVERDGDARRGGRSRRTRSPTPAG